MGLNRTSVGLKLERGGVWGSHVIEPQSNQRGIETNLPRGGYLLRQAASIEPAWD